MTQGEVVWALTCAGQPPMTKTDFAFGFDTVLAHIQAQSKEKENKFATTNTWLTIPAFTGGAGLAVPGQSPREAREGNV